MAPELASRLPSLVQEEVVGVESLIAVPIVRAAVRAIRPLMGNQLHLRRRGAPSGVGAIVGCSCAELGERCLRGPHSTSEGVALNWVIAVHTVESDIGLVAASAIYRAAAAVILRHTAVSPGLVRVSG